MKIRKTMESKIKTKKEEGERERKNGNSLDEKIKKLEKIRCMLMGEKLKENIMGFKL